MKNYISETFVPDVLNKKKGELPKLRGLHEYDINSLEYLRAYTIAKDLRQQVYHQALALFKSSPKILHQLHIDDVDNKKNTGLALFNNKFTANPLNSLLIVKRFLENRADILVDSSEKSQIPILLSFVENLIDQEL